MARRKTLIRIPFIKTKIDKKTIFNIIGFIIIGSAFIILISELGLFSSEDKGLILNKINQTMSDNLGIIGFLVPFVLFLISGHFFSSKKFKFVKPNVTIGSVLIFISLLGVFKSGISGQYIYDSLTTDFSLAGAMVILLITFFMGLILFLDTSVDAFFIFLIKGLKGLYVFIKSYFFRTTLLQNKSRENALKNDDDFIFNKEIAINKHQRIIHEHQTVKNKGDIELKPLVSRSANWVYPPLSILQEVSQKEADRGDVKQNASIIEKTLESFGIRAHVEEVNFGPSVTQYALKITMGTKLSKITALSNDLALALSATTGMVRIEAPIPGRALVGIEIPNRKPEFVTLKKMLQSPAFVNNLDPLLIPLGLDVSGEPQAASIDGMPHVLVAGATGSGKSVLLNSWICTFLFRTKPEDLQMILVDPKRVEMTLYSGIPHLLTDVIVDSDKTVAALKWTVNQMEVRYKEFAKVGARNLAGYNSTPGVIKKPYILFVIDELASLMMFETSGQFE